jgi:hypothetical protein
VAEGHSSSFRGGLKDGKFVVNKAEVDLTEIPLKDHVKGYPNKDALDFYTRPAGREDYKLKAYLSSVLPEGSIAVDLGSGPWEFGIGAYAFTASKKTQVYTMGPRNLNAFAREGQSTKEKFMKIAPNLKTYTGTRGTIMNSNVKDMELMRELFQNPKCLEDKASKKNCVDVADTKDAATRPFQLCLPEGCSGKEKGDVILNSMVISPTFTGEEQGKKDFVAAMVKFLQTHAYAGLVLLSGTHESQTLKAWERTNFDGMSVHKVDVSDCGSLHGTHLFTVSKAAPV